LGKDSSILEIELTRRQRIKESFIYVGQLFVDIVYFQS